MFWQSSQRCRKIASQNVAADWMCSERERRGQGETRWKRSRNRLIRVRRGERGECEGCEPGRVWQSARSAK